MRHKTFKNKKYLKLLLAVAVVTTIGITIQENDGSMRVSASVMPLNAGTDITNETANLIDTTEFEKGLVIEEKTAIDPIYIFSSTNELRYTDDAINVMIEPKDTADVYATLKKGSEVSVLGYNEFGYIKISFEEQELYIKDENLVESTDEIFYDCDYTMYTNDSIELYDSITKDNVLAEIDKYEEVQVVAENDSALSMITYNGETGFIYKESLMEYLPQEAYLRIGTDGVTDYFENNVYNGILATVPDDQITDENLDLLARLIHCEAGGQTEEGKLAVATVVVNRMYDGAMGTTVQSVIERPGQFSPVASGKVYRTTYTEDDYNAAYKVLVEGYRSFPAYVMYFQSNYEGYFSGQSTYCICYTASKSSPQYFSYKKRDLNKYGYLDQLIEIDPAEEDRVYGEDPDIFYYPLNNVAQTPTATVTVTDYGTTEQSEE